MARRKSRNSVNPDGMRHAYSEYHDGILTLHIPDLPPSLNEMLNSHFMVRQREKDQWFTTIRQATIGNRVNYGAGTMVFYHMDACHLRDVDNLAASMKYPLDCLHRCGILPDDDPAMVTRLITTQSRVAHRNEQGIRITLMPEQRGRVRLLAEIIRELGGLPTALALLRKNETDYCDPESDH